MKKVVVGIIVAVIIAIAIVLSKYNEYKTWKAQIDEFNLEYEQYVDIDVYGTDIATIINKAVDYNEGQQITKDENGNYIQNDENSINIQIQIDDEEEDKIYTMETLYNGGMDTFVQYYDTITFRCVDVEYNSQGKVSYMLFEQTSY